MQIPQQKLIITQDVEVLEIFTKLETKNRYRILDSANNNLFFAYEESKFFSRQFLKAIRPLRLVIISKNKQPELIIERDFFMIRPHYIIKLPNGEIIGHIKKKHWWSVYAFGVYDGKEKLEFTCSPQFPIRPWTYDITINNSKAALIQKSWSGIGKEIYTDADNYLLDFGSVKNNAQKLLLMATVFAIDLTRFEKK